jgi:hypothetical protein
MSYLAGDYGMSVVAKNKDTELALAVRLALYPLITPQTRMTLGLDGRPGSPHEPQIEVSVNHKAPI